MKKIEKEITTKTIVTEYEASDGKIFKNEEDCKKWEDSYEHTITNCFKKIPQISVNGEHSYLNSSDYEDEIIAIMPRDLEDIKVINAYVKATACGTELKITHESVGRILLLNFGYNHDWCIYYDLDKHFEQIKKDYDEYKNKIGKLVNGKEND